MIKYVCEPLNKLKQSGYNTSDLRKNKLLGEKTIQMLREGNLVSIQSIEVICRLCNCKVQDIIQYEEES